MSLTRPLDQTERTTLAELFILFANRGREIRRRRTAVMNSLDNVDVAAAREDLDSVENTPERAPARTSDVLSSQAEYNGEFASAS